MGIFFPMVPMARLMDGILLPSFLRVLYKSFTVSLLLLFGGSCIGLQTGAVVLATYNCNSLLPNFNTVSSLGADIVLSKNVV